MTKISLFTPAFNKKPSTTITIEEFIGHIKYGEYEDQVTAVRIESNDEKRKELKKSVPGVTISGTFTPTRIESNLVEHSGFICIDIDGFTDRDDLISDPYTYALFASISNGGLAVLVRVNPEKHKESFKWLQNYYFKSYGITIDPAPQNTASLRFVSFDPKIFINEKAKKSRFTSRAPRKVQSIPAIFPQDTVGELVREAVSSGVNLADDYQDYIALGFSLASGFGEAGRQYFHALSQSSEKYNSAHCDRQYNLCIKRPNAGITVGTFYWMLKNAGIVLPKNEQYDKAVTIAAMAKRSGRKKEGVEQALIEMNDIPKEDAKRIANEVYERPDIELKTIAGDPEKLIESMMEWLRANHPLRLNEITSKIEELDGSDIGRERMNTIYLRARAAFNTPHVNFDLIERMIYSDFTESFHPIKEYIEKNSHRNTTGNLQRLVDCIDSDTPGFKIFIKKWMLCIAAAVHGHPVRLVLALLGSQYTGKTEWFRRLLPADLHRYYGESKMDAGKDDELLMCQKLIVMDDEMGGKSKSDEKRFKELTSKSTFSLRAPYGRYNEDYKRLAILCGTSNDPEVINDPTGNTRILPVNILSIDHEAYNAIDKDELFMEVCRLYEAGEDHNLSRDNMTELSEVSSEYEVINSERELILKFFSPELKTGFTEHLTATEIKDHIESETKQKIMSMKRFGTELKSIFGDRKAKKIANKVMQFYSLVRNVSDQKTESQPASNGAVTKKVEPMITENDDEPLPF